MTVQQYNLNKSFLDKIVGKFGLNPFRPQQMRDFLIELFKILSERRN